MRVLLVLFIAFCLPAPAKAEWHKIVSTNFIVFSEGKPEQTIEFTRKIERFDSFLRTRFNIPTAPAPYPLTIFLAGSGMPSAKLVHGRDSSILGFYTVGPDGPVAIADRFAGDGGKFSLDAETILFHEYVHHFMFQYSSAAYPAWFVEGFAEFYSTTDFDKEGRAQFGKPAYYRGYDLVVTDAIPAKMLLTADVGTLDQEEVRSFYARSWLATHFLTFEPSRQGQLARYLVAVAGGTAPLEAAISVFGDLAAFDKELNAYRDRRKISYATDMRVLTPPTDIARAPLDAGEAATIIERIKIMRQVREEERPAVLASLEKARAKFPASAAIPALIAQIHYEAKRDKEAIAAADIALSLSPAEPRASLYKALAEMRELVRRDVTAAETWKITRSLIVKANRANPNNPYPLFHYFRSFRQQGVATPPLAIQGLARAHQIVPQDEEIRYAYAFVLIDEKNYQAALRLIKPVAFDPHARSDYGRNLVVRLEKAIAGKGDFDGEEPPDLVD